ncbi:hypothetical protein HDC93_004229 [Streptomyces sp. AK010]|nr:hypothetical protein [Streptomyces sp. AK010]
MHGQMHVHAGWSRGYSFDDRFTEALDCLTAPPRLSFPVACDEVAGFGEVRWRRSIRSAAVRDGRGGAAQEKRELRRGAAGRPFDWPTGIRNTAAACEDGEK